MNARLLSISATALLALLLATAIPASAGHTFSSTGVAKRGDEVFRLNASGHLDQLGPPGSAIFSLQFFLPAPTPADPFAVSIVDNVSLTGWTNFIDATTQPVPLLVVQTDYWAESGDGVSFRLDGIRTAQTVTADGHYLDYELHIGPELVSV
jgi:hypothetical protein